MSIYVQVYDLDGAFFTYFISDTVTVTPIFNDTLINALILVDANSDTYRILNGGSYLSSIQEIQRVASLMNEQSLSDKLGSMITIDHSVNKYSFPLTYGPLFNYTGVKPVIH